MLLQLCQEVEKWTNDQRLRPSTVSTMMSTMASTMMSEHYDEHYGEQSGARRPGRGRGAHSREEIPERGRCEYQGDNSQPIKYQTIYDSVS